MRDSDGTLIVSRAAQLSGGSEFTARCAERLGRPWLHAHPGADEAGRLRGFLERHRSAWPPRRAEGGKAGGAFFSGWISARR